MQTVVVYDTKFGNTEKVAHAIARGVATIASVQVMDTVEAAQSLTERPDLLVVGGPTQRRGPSPELRAFVDSLPRQNLQGATVASFDTRYRGSTWIMGSAAAEVAKRIGKAGGRLIARPESFFMSRGGPLERQSLEAGELERAETWGRAVAGTALGH